VATKLVARIFSGRLWETVMAAKYHFEEFQHPSDAADVGSSKV